jgi:cell division septation protein DedD
MARGPAAGDDDAGPAASRGSRVISVFVTLLALGGFAGVVWYAYTMGMQGGGAVPPMIRADNSPTKIKPEQPGGMAVPHQDVLVYQNLGQRGQQGGAQPRVERLLPPPEQPVARPVAPPAPPPSSAVPSPGASASSGPPSRSESAVAGALPRGSLGTLDAPVSGPAPSNQTAAAPSTGAGGQGAARTVQQNPAAATVAPTPGGRFRIQLAALRTDEQARAEWNRLQRQHRDVLGSLTLNVSRIDQGDRGTFYRIQAGPLDEAKARQSCDTLKQRNLGCILVRQ